MRFDIEHEVSELIFSRGKSKPDLSGPDHYEVIWRALQMANNNRMLTYYLQMKRVRFAYYQKHGAEDAMNEHAFYTEYVHSLLTGKD